MKHFFLSVYITGMSASLASYKDYHAARQEWSRILEDRLGNVLMKRFQEYYKRCCEECARVQREKRKVCSPARAWELLLKDVSNWNEAVMQREMRHVISQCPNIEAMVKQVYLATLYCLGSVRFGADSSSAGDILETKIPEFLLFVTKLYVIYARELSGRAGNGQLSDALSLKLARRCIEATPRLLVREEDLLGKSGAQSSSLPPPESDESATGDIKEAIAQAASEAVVGGQSVPPTPMKQDIPASIPNIPKTPLAKPPEQPQVEPKLKTPAKLMPVPLGTPIKPVPRSTPSIIPQMTPKAPQSTIASAQKTLKTPLKQPAMDDDLF